MKTKRLLSAACLLSLIGIWPRFIEPNLLSTTRIQLKIPHLPVQLNQFKILQMSDLHLNPSLSDILLKKIISKTKILKPDMIVYTGDFLCQSKILEKERLTTFLSQFQAPYGCFCVLGNHDYSSWVSVDRQGDYAIMEHGSSGMHRLLKKIQMTGKVCFESDQPKLHDELLELLDDTPFRLLHNQTLQIPIHGSYLNVCGLGEYTTGHFKPGIAFSQYDSSYSGIVLAHNPDSVPTLQKFPGDLIVCGHTHGAQINLPWLWNRLTLIENIEYKRGLKCKEKKWIYTNRGIGSTSPIRLFSLPEITLFTLES